MDAHFDLKFPAKTDSDGQFRSTIIICDNGTGKDHRLEATAHFLGGAFSYKTEPNHDYSFKGQDSETLRGIVIPLCHLPTPIVGTVPLYRYWNPGNGDHFYTVDKAEGDNAVKGGYKAEGITGYIYPQQNSGTVPLYRYWNQGNGDHFYTVDKAERDNAVKGGYKAEGCCLITGYIYPPQTNISSRTLSSSI